MASKDEFNRPYDHWSQGKSKTKNIVGTDKKTPPKKK